MDADIQYTQQQILDLLRRQKETINRQPTQYVSDLLHRCSELAHEETYSLRTAAAINACACTLILEERGK